MGKLAPGEKAPGFELGDQNGNIQRLGDFGGRRLFVFFYSKASTSG